MTSPTQILEELNGSPAGYYSEREYNWLVLPIEEWTSDENRSWTCIGRPGVDGIEFGHRFGEAGVLAYYPIENTYEKIADSIPDLIAGWTVGEVKI